MAGCNNRHRTRNNLFIERIKGSEPLTLAHEENTGLHDFREESIYFLLTTRFYDGDSSNNFFCRDRIKFNAAGEAEDPHWRGDFKGLIQRLDYIRDIGFSAIWITPPIENRSGLDYHGYHSYDWTRIDPRPPVIICLAVLSDASAE